MRKPMPSKIENLERQVADVAARLPPKPPDPNPWRPVVAALTEDEQADLCNAIVELEKSNGRASLETLPPEQKAVWEKAFALYERR
jgi:hypothetical protein